MPEPDPDTRTPLPALAHVGSERQLLVEFLAGHDIDVPANKLGRQADVLPHLADGE